MELIQNSEGVPLIGFSYNALVTTIGSPSSASAAPPNEDPESFDGKKVYPWGEGNTFPSDAELLIRKSTVLNSGLKYKLQAILGQGIFPARVSGYKDDGTEILEIIDDPDVQKLLRSRKIRRYLTLGTRDILKFGNSFPEFIFNEDGSRITGINIINAKHCRWGEMVKGVIKHLYVYGNWKDGTPSKKGSYKELRVLDIFDPLADLISLREDKKLAGKSVIFPLRDEFSNNDYYPLPDWYSAKEAGWVEISSKVPSFLKKVYENQISWRWHVKIPYAYWDKRFPKTEFKDVKKRSELMNAEMDMIEQSLTGDENAAKALFTHFEVNHQGKPEEQWIIEPLDNKFKSEHQLIESAVADSNILFSINVNPTIMGAGLPGSGPYAGKTGGSDIRESFLVNVALAWLDRQMILDPIECMLEFNGIEDVEIRFRNTILTTLDSGGGTKKVVS
ncbi:MAG: hypothetical protein RQ761_03720 [Bacteroidales bacterium]|nr:hypothetical protein [Bacteroidales bacterium]